jgi:LacI family transcriptional regulator
VAQLPSPNGNRRLIGYVTCSLSNNFQSQLLNGAERAARDCGYRLLFSNSGRDVEQESLLIHQLVEDDIQGVLIWPVLNGEASTELTRLVRQNAIPLVCMDRMHEGWNCDYVASDNFHGGYIATQHLLGLGHEHIVFLSAPTLKLRPVAERLRGYRAAMEAAGLAPQAPWLVGTNDEEHGFRYLVRAYLEAKGPEIDELVRLLAAQPRPTAIFAVNDLIAMQVLQAARKVNLRVPEDLSVVGFDDQAELITQLKVPLTTVAQDTYAIGQRAAELLIKRIEGYHGPSSDDYLPVRLITRSSTGLPASKA